MGDEGVLAGMVTPGEGVMDTGMVLLAGLAVGLPLIFKSVVLQAAIASEKASKRLSFRRLTLVQGLMPHRRIMPS